jgi:hypothetical protein
VAASFASPPMLALALHRHIASSPPPSDPTFAAIEPCLPWLAATLLALDPLCLALGESGQSEPLFQLAFLAGCFAFDRRAFVLSGLAFGVAVALRFEGWALLPVLFLVAFSDRPRRLRAAPAWAIPGAVALAWCVVHYRATGEPLQFLRLNKDFVRGYFRDVGYVWGGYLPDRHLMAIWYVVIVPLMWMLGPAHAFVLGARPWIATRSPAAFRWLSLALVVIVTAGFMFGSHLGLPRHGVALAPLFATAVAVGACSAAAWVQARFALLERWSRASFVALCAALLVVYVFEARALPRYRELSAEHAFAYASPAAAARALRAASGDAGLIFCDQSEVEILSTLPPRLFNRYQLTDVTDFHIAHASPAGGPVLVVSTPERTKHITLPRKLIWTDGELVILRFEATRGA